jgi:uncharacterized protein with PQ loop repeat
MLDLKEIALYSNWIVNIFFFIKSFPQLIQNYLRGKPGRMMSDWMLWGFITGNIFYGYYTYSLNLPMSYKVMVPLTGLGSVLISLQRIYYVGKGRRRKMLGFYGANLSWVIAIFFLGSKTPSFGYYTGYLATISWTFAPLVQIIEIFKNKSVKGISLLFLVLSFSGVFVEFITVIILGLPIPSIVVLFEELFYLEF